jgi:hypothetical protein
MSVAIPADLMLRRRSILEKYGLTASVESMTLGSCAKLRTDYLAALAPDFWPLSWCHAIVAT